ncbi:trypsin delta-like [Schistocerca gregaria]|uniref:trypsin delta-like n=1 Tax=Schistocerca gregaria TaxID=7010 RepID=UPI00211F3CA6|nr:trypsin delta-like [Schistocerca gregaria]
MAISDSFPLGANIQVVSLAAADYESPGGLTATLTGCGSLTFDGDEACQQLIDSVPTSPLEVTPRMVSAGEAGRAACVSDAGGPLVSAGTQVGVTSLGVFSVCENSGTTFANVGSLDYQPH